MSQETFESARRFALPVKQTRSRQTRDRLLAAGFRSLRCKHFDELSVADIARAAGCAVGSFYLRFVDKDQYFLAIAEMRREQSRALLAGWYDGATRDNVVGKAVARELEFVLEQPDFWRAALRKGATDQTFWQEFRELGRESVSRFIDCHTRLIGRALSEQEIERVRFAFQMVRGTLNNTLMNQPGPFQLEDEAFRLQLERAFQLVAGIEPA